MEVQEQTKTQILCCFKFIFFVFLSPYMSDCCPHNTHTQFYNYSVFSHHARSIKKRLGESQRACLHLSYMKERINNKSITIMWCQSSPASGLLLLLSVIRSFSLSRWSAVFVYLYVKTLYFEIRFTHPTCCDDNENYGETIYNHHTTCTSLSPVAPEENWERNILILWTIKGLKGKLLDSADVQIF